MTWMDTETMQEVAAWYEAAEPSDHLVDERDVLDPETCHHDHTTIEDTDPERRYPEVEHCEDCGTAWRVPQHRTRRVC